MTPPADTESERLVLSYLLAPDDPDGVDHVLEGLTEQHFTDPDRQAALGAIRQLATEGVTPNTASVAEALRASGAAEPGHATLLRWTLEMPSALSTARVARRQLGEVRRWRVLHELGTYLAGAHQRTRVTVDKVVQQALVDLEALGEDSASDVANMGDVMQRRVGELRAAEGKPVRRVHTGFRPLDKLTGGFGESDLVVLAGATGGGKSTLAEHVLAAMAGRGHNVLVASAEMLAWELADRLLSRVSYVPATSIRDNQLDGDQLRTLESIAGHGSWRHVGVIERNGALTVQRIGQVAREMQRRQGLGLIVVDYLQLVSSVTGPNERGRTRQAEVAAVARGLKNLALDLRVPVLALSQFNREAAKGESEPELHHLRESGEIEQAANIVLFVWEHPEDAKDDTLRRLICKKHRSGAVNTSVKLRWSAKTLSFEAAT